jgi:hypothetical protein
MLSYIRDFLTVAVFVSIFVALIVHTIRVEFSFLSKDNKPAGKSNAPARKKFNGSAAAFVR